MCKYKVITFCNYFASRVLFAAEITVFVLDSVNCDTKIAQKR